MKKRFIKDLVFISLFVAIMVICSWITIPFTVPFTLQTFGVFSAILMLGSKKGTIAIIVYCLLGLIGLPVFSGFNGGLAYIFGPTGGFIIGFIAIGLISILFEYIIKLDNKVLALVIGLIICYMIGLIWLSVVTNTFTIKGILKNSLIVVIPFIIIDVIKLWLAYFINKRIGKKINQEEVN